MNKHLFTPGREPVTDQNLVNQGVHWASLDRRLALQLWCQAPPSTNTASPKLPARFKGSSAMKGTLSPATASHSYNGGQAVNLSFLSVLGPSFTHPGENVSVGGNSYTIEAYLKLKLHQQMYMKCYNLDLWTIHWFRKKEKHCKWKKSLFPTDEWSTSHRSVLWRLVRSSGPSSWDPSSFPLKLHFLKDPGWSLGPGLSLHHPAFRLHPSHLNVCISTHRNAQAVTALLQALALPSRVCWAPVFLSALTTLSPGLNHRDSWLCSFVRSSCPSLWPCCVQLHQLQDSATVKDERMFCFVMEWCSHKESSSGSSLLLTWTVSSHIAYSSGQELKCSMWCHSRANSCSFLWILLLHKEWQDLQERLIFSE